MVNSKRGYIYQFGQWWSVPLEKWLQALEEGYFNLDEIGRRINPPYQVAWFAGANSQSIIDKGVAYVARMPCDWDEENWKNEIETVKAWLNKKNGSKSA